MKSLIDYLKECDGCATPGTTLGMGNPAAPDGAAVGSGDVPTGKVRKQRRKKVSDKKQRNDEFIEMFNK